MFWPIFNHNMAAVLKFNNSNQLLQMTNNCLGEGTSKKTSENYCEVICLDDSDDDNCTEQEPPSNIIQVDCKINNSNNIKQEKPGQKVNNHLDQNGISNDDPNENVKSVDLVNFQSYKPITRENAKTNVQQLMNYFVKKEINSNKRTIESLEFDKPKAFSQLKDLKKRCQDGLLQVQLISRCQSGSKIKFNRHFHDKSTSTNIVDERINHNKYFHTQF